MKSLISALLLGLSLAVAAPTLAQDNAGAAAPVAAPVAPLEAAPPPVALAPPTTEGAPPTVAPAALRPVEGVGQPVPAGYRIQSQVTDDGAYGLWMHDIVLMPIITLISLFVLGLLLWVIVRYRRAANPIPSKTSHNTLIEVIWTLVPVLILVAIAIPSISLLAQQYRPVGPNAVTIKAIGNQWYWTYEYPDHGGFEIVSNMLPDEVAKQRGEPRLLAVDNRVVVPVGVPVRVLTTSNDVLHSWAMPAFWIKMDAVPGRINETSFTVTKPGVYYGQCSELCGSRHGYMPIAVEAVPPAQFAQWVLSKGGSMPGAKPAGSDPTGDRAAEPVDPITPVGDPNLNVQGTTPAVTAPANRATDSSALRKN